jgi:hypothetical protein
MVAIVDLRTFELALPPIAYDVHAFLATWAL